MSVPNVFSNFLDNVLVLHLLPHNQHLVHASQQQNVPVKAAPQTGIALVGLVYAVHSCKLNQNLYFHLLSLLFCLFISESQPVAALSPTIVPTSRIQVIPQLTRRQRNVLTPLHP